MSLVTLERIERVVIEKLRNFRQERFHLENSDGLNGNTSVLFLCPVDQM